MLSVTEQQRSALVLSGALANPLAALRDRGLRREYVECGRGDARRALRLD